MANPKVQKILSKVQGFFTNHGEKVAVGFGAAVFVLGAATAITKPTISITPDQVATNADAAQKNINQPQDEASILETLANDGIKELNFADTVSKTESEKIDVNELRLKHKWVTLEPGAGLIRDQPVLVAINDVLAVAGRGGTTLFEVDDKGNRLPDDGTDSEKDEKSTKGGKGGRGGMGMGMGMGGQTKQSPREKQEEEARLKREQEARSKSLAGNVDLAKEEAKKKARDEAKKKEQAAAGVETAGNEQQGPFKEKLKPIRWAAVTGVIDHKAFKESYAKALRQDVKAANPNYKQIELERQTLQSDGTWSDWEALDVAKNNLVLDNLTEVDEELVPQENILASIVEPLPFLLNGAFGGVHVASLVPKEKRDIPKPDPKSQGGMGMMGGGRGGRGGMGMMGGSMGGQEGMAGAGMGMMGGSKGGSMGGMMGGDDMAGFMFGGGTGSADEGDFPKTDADEVMVRAFDFTVDPDATYKYRARIVVNNPNYKRDDINPGVDFESQTLTGPWSQITNPVYVPSDVAPYAISKTPPTNQNPTSNQVTFQVASFNPEDGITVVRQFIAGPGMIIGEPTSTQIPASDGSGAKPKTVDFTSRQIVLATVGGNESLAPLGGNGSITMPAMAFVMKPDGSIVIRNEAKDANDPDLKFVQEVYAEELKKSDTKRKKGDMNGMGMGDMMGGMGGMGSGGP